MGSAISESREPPRNRNDRYPEISRPECQIATLRKWIANRDRLIRTLIYIPIYLILTLHCLIVVGGGGDRSLLLLTYYEPLYHSDTIKQQLQQVVT